MMRVIRVTSVLPAVKYGSKKGESKLATVLVHPDNWLWMMEVDSDSPLIFDRQQARTFIRMMDGSELLVKESLQEIVELI